jgi:hypothetical protein
MVGGKSFRFWCCFGSELGDGLVIGCWFGRALLPSPVLCEGGSDALSETLVDVVGRSGREERLVRVVVLGGVGRAEDERRPCEEFVRQEQEIGGLH